METLLDVLEDLLEWLVVLAVTASLAALVVYVSWNWLALGAALHAARLGLRPCFAIGALVGFARLVRVN